MSGHKRIRKMKINLLMLLLLSFTSCDKRVDEVVKIKLEYVSFDTETIYAVTCKDFEKAFGSDIKKKIITNKTLLRQFSNYLLHLQQDKDNYKPDVRAQITIIKRSGQVKTLCMSALGAELDGKSIIIDKRFIDFVEKIEADD